MKAFVVNVDNCSGCYNCQIGCKDEHCGNDWTPFAKPQPEAGQFWGKIEEYTRGQNSHVKVSYVFVPCQHCEDAPCIDACSYGAIIRRDDGLIYIDPKTCAGCKNCLDENGCPYGKIYFNSNLNIAQKCTGCAHLLDARGWTTTRCADNCPHEAVVFGDASDLDLTDTETLYPELGLTPRVHYIGLPKRFVAGTVYDSTSMEIVSGATCTLSGDAGSASATTDDFGDFWIDDLGEGAFTVTITSGSKTVTLTGDTTDGDVGFADIDING